MSTRRSLRYLLAGAMVSAACATGGTGQAVGQPAATTKPTHDGAAATAADEGFRFTFNATVRTDGAQPGVPAGPSEMAFVTRVLGSRMRVDFGNVSDPLMPKGRYMIADVATQVMYAVTPSDRTVIVSSLDTLPAAPSDADEQYLTKVSVSDTSSRVEDLGPGESVLGFVTRKYRVTRSHTRRTDMSGRIEEARTESVATMHLTTELVPQFARVEVFNSMFGHDLGGSASRAAASATIRALDGSVPKGFTLLQEEERRVTRSGTTTTTQSISRMTAFARGGVPASELTVPAGYTITDMREPTRER